MANYNKLTPELLEQLKNIVGADRFQAGEDINPDYAHDEMPIYGKYMPECVCDVLTTEEVSAIM